MILFRAFLIPRHMSDLTLVDSIEDFAFPHWTVVTIDLFENRVC